MSDLNKQCDVCGGKDFYAGVASSALGPVSYAFCDICLAMGAEAKFMVQATVECCGGLSHVHERAGLVYFDIPRDCYVDYRTKETIPIIFKDGTKYNTRTECIKELRKREA